MADGNEPRIEVIADAMRLDQHIAGDRDSNLEANQQTKQDALEEIGNGYMALCAVADLIGARGGRDREGYLKDLGDVTADDLAQLLGIIARQIGTPLERIGFAMPRHCIPPGRDSAT